MPILEGVVFNAKDMLAPFHCDVQRCKGACCFIEGELGAPLARNEIDKIESILPEIWDLIPEKSKEIIRKQNWWIKSNGKYYTNVVDKRECVFVYFENGIARCAIETKYHQNKINFRKPISCHLFPLREYSFFFSEIIYVKIPECQSGIENGQKLNIPLYKSLKDALIRRFGEKWYNNLVENELNGEKDKFSGGGK